MAWDEDSGTMALWFLLGILSGMVGAVAVTVAVLVKMGLVATPTLKTAEEARPPATPVSMSTTSVSRGMATPTSAVRSEQDSGANEASTPAAESGSSVRDSSSLATESPDNENNRGMNKIAAVAGMAMSDVTSASVNEAPVQHRQLSTDAEEEELEPYPERTESMTPVEPNIEEHNYHQMRSAWNMADGTMVVSASRNYEDLAFNAKKAAMEIVTFEKAFQEASVTMNPRGDGVMMERPQSKRAGAGRMENATFAGRLEHYDNEGPEHWAAPGGVVAVQAANDGATDSSVADSLEDVVMEAPADGTAADALPGLDTRNISDHTNGTRGSIEKEGIRPYVAGAGGETEAEADERVKIAQDSFIAETEYPTHSYTDVKRRSGDICAGMATTRAWTYYKAKVLGFNFRKVVMRKNAENFELYSENEPIATVKLIGRAAKVLGATAFVNPKKSKLKIGYFPATTGRELITSVLVGKFINNQCKVLFRRSVDDTASVTSDEFGRFVDQIADACRLRR